MFDSTALSSLAEHKVEYVDGKFVDVQNNGFLYGRHTHVIEG